MKVQGCSAFATCCVHGASQVVFLSLGAGSLDRYKQLQMLVAEMAETGIMGTRHTTGRLNERQE